MNETIRVYVVDYGRASLYMRYTDPHTGKHIAKSGTAKRKDADRVAAKWEAELQEGRYKPASKVTWDEFRERYEKERLSGMSDSYFASMGSALNRLESLGVQRLAQVDADLLSRYQAALRDDKVSETTIASYLKHVKAALAWGVEVGMIDDDLTFGTVSIGADLRWIRGRQCSAGEWAAWQITAAADQAPGTYIMKMAVATANGNTVTVFQRIQVSA